MSDPSGPSLWEVMAVDPSIPIDQATLRLVIRDQRRRSRTLLYPWVRVLSRVAVTVIVVGKRVCPVRFSAHATMDRLCLWFLRRFVSPDAVSLLIRHFIVETNLLNFCVRNAGVPGLPEVSLRPRTLAELGNRAVIEHDLNVYRVLFALGRRGPPGRRDRADLDFGMLDIPRHRSGTADPPPAQPRHPDRAVPDEHPVRALPDPGASTGGPCTRCGWTPRCSPCSPRSPATARSSAGGQRSRRCASTATSTSRRMVYEHAVLCEYAHARLSWMSGR